MALMIGSRETYTRASILEAKTCDTPMQQHGWFFQPYVDLNSIHALSLALDMASTQTPDRSMKTYFKSVYSLEDCISPRLRALFKIVQGAPTNYGKEAWAIIKAVVVQEDAQAVNLDSINFELIESFLTAMVEVLPKGFVEVFNKFIELVGDSRPTEEALHALGKAASGLEGVTPAEGQEREKKVLTAATEVSKILLQAADVVAVGTDFCRDAPTMHAFPFMFPVGADHDAAKHMITEEDIPEEITNFDWFEANFAILSNYPLKQESLVHELTNRVSRIAKFYRAMMAMSNARSEEEVARQVDYWSTIWSDEKVCLRAICSFQSGSPGEQLDPLCKVFIDCSKFGGTIISFMSAVVGSKKPFQDTLLQECARLEGTLPSELLAVRIAARTFANVESLWQKITSASHDATLTELTTTIAQYYDVEKTSPQMSALRRLDAHVAGLVQTWVKKFNIHAENVTATEVVVDFNTTYSPLQAAIDKWDFTDCPYIADPTSQTPRELASNKKVESAIMSFPHLSSTLAKIKDKTGWLDQEQKDKFTAALHHVEVLREKVNLAASLSAQLVLASLVQKESVEAYNAGLVFCESKLGVPVASLPKNLLTRLKATKMDSQSSTTASSGTKVMGPPAPANVSQQPASEPRRIMKRKVETPIVGA